MPERFKDQEGYGSVWTWTAIDADTKLMLTWFIGARDTALMFMFYNFCRPHMTLRQGKTQRTPAMAADVADNVWALEEMLALMPEQPKGRVRKIGAPPESERRLIGAAGG